MQDATIRKICRALPPGTALLAFRLTHPEAQLALSVERARLRHGEIGKGLNDYDAIFTELKRVGFDGWISIEDGVDGIDQLQRNVDSLKRKIGLCWS
jgi:sugar phosphate isomerase/epimerase